MRWTANRMLPLGLALVAGACAPPPAHPALRLQFELSFDPAEPHSDQTVAVVPVLVGGGSGIDDVEFTALWTDAEGSVVSEGLTVAAANTDRGDVYSVRVVPSDTVGEGAPLQAEVTILNGPPVVSTLGFEPATPSAGAPITAVATATDPDGDALTLDYTWTRTTGDGEGDGTFAGQTLPAELAAPGTAWRVSVVATDGQAVNGQSAPEVREVSLVNEAPVIRGITLSPEQPTTADAITAEVDAIDPDGGELTYEVTWIIEDRGLAGLGLELPAGNAFKGEVVKLQVIATDDDGPEPLSSDPFVTAGLVVVNALPTVTDVAVVPDPPTRAGPATCQFTLDDPDPGDADTLVAQIRWTQNGGRPAGADSETLPGTQLRRGDTLDCEVTPFDGVALGTAVRSDEVVVGNSPPTLTGAVIDPEPAFEGSELVCEGEGADDLDGDDVTLAVEWVVEGVTVSGAAETLTGDDFDEGDEVECTLTPNDGLDDGAPVDADPVTVANSPPTDPGVSLGPGTSDLPLVCSVSTASTDDDPGDTVSYLFRWEKDSVGFTAGGTTTYAGDTVPSSSLSVGATYTCFVTATDGDDDSDEIDASVTVSAP